MSNKGDFDRKDLNTFKMLMMYLNPIGSVGTNVDMYWDDIEYFDDVFFSTTGEQIKPPRMFKQFLEKVDSLKYNYKKEVLNKKDAFRKYKECIKNKSSNDFLYNLQISIQFFEAYEEYEKCALMKNIQDKINQLN